jgi:hypothetical protein
MVGKQKIFYIHPFTLPVKTYPFWNILIDNLKEAGYKVVQFKFKNEPSYNNVDEVITPSFPTIVELLKDPDSYLISNDSFIPHLLNVYLPTKKNFVLFGCTNPDIYGYSQNINILKSKSFLVENQFTVLKDLQPNKNMWIEPIFILEIIEKNL